MDHRADGVPEAGRDDDRHRAWQQTAAADLAQLVLTDASLDKVFDRAAAWTADVLGVPLVSVCRHEPHDGRVRLVAGVGWEPGDVGTATMQDADGTAAGIVLRAPGPVFVADTDAETAEMPALFARHGVRSGVGVALLDGPGTPYGILGAHHTVPNGFTEADREFVRTVALVLGSAIARDRDRRTIGQQLADLDAYFDAVPLGVAILDADHRYVRVNAHLAGLAARPAEALAGLPAMDVDPAYDAVMRPYVARVFETGVPLINHEVHIAAGAAPDEVLDWLVSFVPVHDSDVAGTAGGDGAAHGAARVRAVGVVVQDVTPLKRTQAALERLTETLEARVADQTAQVRRLAADLTHAEQRERRRVAHVLHDDLQQRLFALQMKVRVIEQQATDADAPAVRSAADLLRQIVDTTRALTVDLSPPVLADEGVDRLIEWLAVRMADGYGLAVTVRAHGDTRAAPDVQTLLFQLVRELLFNVVHHAGTAAATVTVRRLDGGDLLRIEVADAGGGFDPDALRAATADRLADIDRPAGRLGLFSVRERLHYIGGTLRIASDPQSGTTVTIDVPSRP